MVKTLSFGEKEVQFSTSFAWTFIFKSQFGMDPAKILIPSIQRSFSNEDPEAQAYMLFELLGFVSIAQIAWSMAKLCDRSLPEPEKWIEEAGDNFPALDIVTDLLPEVIESCFSTKKTQAPDQEIPELKNKKSASK